MKTTLLGYCEMKKRKGKVIFSSCEGQNGVVGYSCRVDYLYDDMADKITKAAIGHEISLVYNAGYNGKAFIADVVVK